MRSRILALASLLLVALCVALASRGVAAPSGFVTRVGKELRLDGKPFRFGGANIEWLGLAGYGPADPAGPHYAEPLRDRRRSRDGEGDGRPRRTQPDDGRLGRLRRCASSPSPGSSTRPRSSAIDYALRAARSRGIKVIPTIVGDDARAGGTGCVYLRWRGISVPDCSLVNMEPFWTDPGVLADVEAHVKALLEHVNVYTGVAYKDDPTILGWDLLNGGGSPTPWTRQIAQYVRSLDGRHLILSGANNAGLAAVDACVSFVYPHWSLPPSFVKGWIDTCRAAGKPYIVYEYGWDLTNFPTQALAERLPGRAPGRPRDRRRRLLGAEAHADGHGWMPIPADTTDPPVARTGESGQWWAMYYTGIKTLVMSAGDMAARAQIIRSHNYAMAGRAAAAARAPARADDHLDRGPAASTGGARPGRGNYSIQRAPDAPVPGRRCAAAASPISRRLRRPDREPRSRLVPGDPVQPRRPRRPRVERRAARRPASVSVPRAVSSAGRAPGLHPGGRRFDPVTAHSPASPLDDLRTPVCEHRAMRVARLAAVALVLVLAACGGSSDHQTPRRRSRHRLRHRRPLHRLRSLRPPPPPPALPALPMSWDCRRLRLASRPRSTRRCSGASCARTASAGPPSSSRTGRPRRPSTRPGSTGSASASGLPLGGWGVLRTDPVARGRSRAPARRPVRARPSTSRTPRAEYGYTGPTGPSGARYPPHGAFTGEFRRLEPGLPAAVASYCRPDQHDLDWHAWSPAGFDFLPEAYVNELGPRPPGRQRA